MPKIYDVSVEERNKILLKWIERFGTFKMDHDYPNKGVAWINDTSRFGEELSSKLADISVSQRSPFHYYVRHMHMTIPNFENKFRKMCFIVTGERQINCVKVNFRGDFTEPINEYLGKIVPLSYKISKNKSHSPNIFQSSRNRSPNLMASY